MCAVHVMTTYVKVCVKHWDKANDKKAVLGPSRRGASEHIEVV